MAIRGRRSKASVQVYLIAMALLISLPLLALTAVLLLRVQASDQEILAVQVQGDARDVAAGVSRQLEDMATTLKVLSSAPELRTDLASFHGRIRAALEDSEFFILVVDSTGQQLLNTRVAYGSTLGRTSNFDHLSHILATERVGASGVFFGRTSQKWVFNVTIPLPDPSPGGPAALIMTQNVSELAQRLKSQVLDDEWSAVIVDLDWNVVAGFGPNAPAEGQAFPSPHAGERLAPTGFIDAPFGDSELRLAFASVPGWNWTVYLWGPENRGGAVTDDAWRWLIIGGVPIFALTLVAAFFLGRRLQATIAGIADMAHRLGKGEIVSPIDTVVAEAELVAHALSEASFDRAEAEDAMHVVQSELVHRTKNLLAVAQSMLNQTARTSTSMADFHVAASSRLESLGRSIDLLTERSWGGVNLQSLVETQISNFADSDRIKISGARVLLRPEAVQNLGLAFHELATNAVKYGALSNEAGTVAVTWQSMANGGDPDGFQLSWVEQGGPNVSAPEREGFGTTVLTRVVPGALRGTVDLSYHDGGVAWRLSAPCAAVEQPQPTGDAAKGGA